MTAKRGRGLSSLMALGLALFLASGLRQPGRVTVSRAQDSPPERAAYGYAFTYQGYLEDENGPVNGLCDLAFGLYSDPDAGTLFGSQSLPNTMLVDGRFTARLDFGAAAHTGGARWLAITVRCPAGSGVYTTLEPRQELTAAPAALTLALPFEARGSSGGDLVLFSNSGTGTALTVTSQGGSGLWVASAGTDGVGVYAAGQYGLYVGTSESDGLHVSWAKGDGVNVGAANDDGVYVSHAGSPSNSASSTAHDGFEVAGAQGNGLYVGRADVYGVYVDSAFGGINVNSADNNGLWVDSAGTNGIWIESAGENGVYVAHAGGDGVDVTGNSYAGNFRGNINVTGNCIGCRQAVLGLNVATVPLRPGDVVAIQGIETTALANAPVLWQVVPAGSAGTVVGVVGGRAEIEETLARGVDQGEVGRRLVPRDGDAGPGEYVTIVISGPMQVRASTLSGRIEPGARVAVAEDGLARALRTTVVEGVTLSESAPLIGIALDAPDAEGLVWVLVNPQ